MTPDADVSSTQEQRLQEAIADYLRDRDAGRNPDQAELLARHPDLAEELREFFAGQEQLGRLAAPLRQAIESATDAEVSGTLGDFRIIRQAGKGGMGIVYEAEQISLRRRVALKVLPFAATMDPRHLQRFRNEAQAAACLHHTNIVPVFSVGCERGVHFYAMQFIDGQPLSEVIQQLRGREKKTTQATAEEPTTAYHPPPEGAIADSPTVHRAADSTPLTAEGRRSRDYFRKVAELTVQAAEALDHAHQLGIVHRDVKPGNLLVDSRGNLWVTDFGLAQMQSDTRLTRTGDLVGTLRYMSPEQALAKRVVIDHRTDIYSLGATLYELLTLQPAFTGEDREELLRQIAFEEPKRPRQVERAVPAELETIVQKAMEKRPQDRYATAQELADDLRRWLLDQPIRARRPSWLQVTRKWTRRHQAAVRAASLLLIALLVLGFGFSLWWVSQQATAEADARAALKEADNWQREERWSEALSAVRRAQGVLRGFGSNARLRRQVDELTKDLEMAQRLEEARLLNTAVKNGRFDNEASVTAYVETFARYGLDAEQGDAGATAEYIRSRSIRMQLVAALDRWATLQRVTGGQGWEHLLAVARAADTDGWRNRFRDAWEHMDYKAMNALLPSSINEKMLTLMGNLLVFVSENSVNLDKRLETLLRQAQQRHPSDFWINHDLAMLLKNAQPPQLDEAIRYFMIAVALRPQSPGAHLNLGGVLRDRRMLDEAIAESREAIRLKKDYTEAHAHLGSVLMEKGQLDEAIAELREAIRLKKDLAAAHCVLANALRESGELDEAIAEHREAIRLRKEHSVAHDTPRDLDESAIDYVNLGVSLGRKGQSDEAIAAFRQAIRLKKDLAAAHNNLGSALMDKGQLDDAISEFHEALRSKKPVPEAYFNLGSALYRKGRVDESIGALREGIRLNKYDAQAHHNLGVALKMKGRLDEAIAEFNQAIQLKKDYAEAHGHLGSILLVSGRLDVAIAECREAIRLKKDDAGAHNNLGNALFGKGHLEEAITEFREAIHLEKDSADAHNNLGYALSVKGQLDEAITEYREAIRLKRDDVKAHNNLKNALAERELLAKLPAILSGKAKATDPAELLALASVCQQPYKRLHAAAVRFYTDAFAAQPQLADDLNTQHRYNAACAAALAGCGEGEDAKKLDAKERARLRQQALDWLRADLKPYRQLLEKSAGKVGPTIAQRMQHWLNDPDFAGVRGKKALDQLPKEERSEWRNLWADVAEMLAQTRATTPSAKKPDAK